jgi:multiple sugar transport system substrate-binding protein
MHVKSLLLLVVALLVPFTAAVAQDEPVTITFWHTYNEVSPENAMLVETLIPMFEEQNPNINVEAIPYPYDGFRQAMLTALAGGQGPDLARLDIIWSPEFAAQGVLAALDEVMPDYQEYADRVFPGPLSTNVYQGHTYGLPLTTNTRVFLYNQSMYDAAGVTAPTTVEELAAQCEAITGLGDEIYVFSDGGTSGWNILPWIWTFGGDITDPEITTATGYLNSPETVAALEYLKEMIETGCFSDGMIGSGIDNWGGYFNDTIASIIEGPWIYPTGEAQYPDFEISASLMPTGPGGSISVVGGENIAMFSTSPNQEAALAFLRFTQSPEYQLAMSETGQLTVLPELLETEFYQNHPYYPLYLEQLQTARARTPHPAWTEMEQIVSDASQLILRGEVPAQEALDMAAEAIDGLLAG